MKLFLALSLISFLAAPSSFAKEVSRVKKHLICGSNTATDGDNIVSLPVTLVTFESGGSTFQNIEIPKGPLKIQLVQGITDASPARIYQATVYFGEYSNSIQIKTSSYSLALTPSVRSIDGRDTVLGADRIDKEIGPVECSLRDKSYNDGLKGLE